nr:hypothetical protein [Tanacetum cinerariifolium]
MACIEKIAKDSKLIKIEDQLLVLIKRQVETELMLEEKFREIYVRRINDNNRSNNKAVYIEACHLANPNEAKVVIARGVKYMRLFLKVYISAAMVNAASIVNTAREMMSQTRSIRGRANSAQPHLVFANDDLLTEILIRLPILRIHLFTTLSKQWRRILTSPDFTLSRSKIPNLDPPVGIFANDLRSLFECDFVSLDSRLNSKKLTMDHSFGFAEEVDHVRILQSCNGLLYNGVLRMAFDPRKLLYYKMVQAGPTSGDTQIQIYSSETRNWILCRNQFDYFSFNYFNSVIYWHDAFHWLEGLNRRRNFLESIGGYSDDPILLLMEIPHMLHLEGKIFKSCGCLLLVYINDIGFREFTIYKRMKGCSMWTVRYVVNTDDFMTPLPEQWSIRSTV